MDKNSKIKKLRELIDKLDNKISKLIIKRFELAKKIGKIKKSVTLPIRDEKREVEVIKRVLKTTNKYKNEIKEIYKKIIEKSRKIQK